MIAFDPRTETQEELDRIAIEADSRLERMSFGQFRMRADGLYLADDKKSLRIAGPFEVVGRARDPSGDDWARWVRFHDADNRQHQVAVKDADLHGDPAALAANLARQGLWVSPKHRKQLVEYFNGIYIAERLTTVDRTGWHTIQDQLVFVLPGETFGKPENELVVLNGAERSPYGSRGSLADWQDGICRLTASHRLPVLAVSTAFAGPLLSPSGQDGGGIHSRGQSSTGKTAMARAAASVWGPRTYMRSWRSTANGLEGAAVLATDTLLVLDELGVIESRELNAATYQLAIGAGKGRARRDGSMRTPASWRVMVFSTGEVTIRAKVEEDHSRRAKAGQEIRILDIPADAGKGYGAFDSIGTETSAAKLADAILKSSEEFYGTAGPEFIRKLTEMGTETAAITIAEKIDAFLQITAAVGTEGQIRRAARRLALIAAAGEMAIEFGIVPHWCEGEATAAAEFALRQWIASRGGNEAAEALAAVQQVRLFIEKYGTSRFEDVDNPTSMIPNRAGWRRGNGQDQVWMIPPEVWKSEVCRGLDPKLVAQVLAEKNMLLRAADGWQKVHKISGRPVRCYTITTSILSGLGVEDGVTDVTGVTKRFLEGAATNQKPNDTDNVTSVTPVTPQKHRDGVTAGNGDDRARCTATTFLKAGPFE